MVRLLNIFNFIILIRGYRDWCRNNNIRELNILTLCDVCGVNDHVIIDSYHCISVAVKCKPATSVQRG